jgi:hypothetical protein
MAFPQTDSQGAPKRGDGGNAIERQRDDACEPNPRAARGSQSLSSLALSKQKERRFRAKLERDCFALPALGMISNYQLPITHLLLTALQRRGTKLAQSSS